MMHTFCSTFRLITNDIENKKSSGHYFLNQKYIEKLLTAYAKFDIDQMTISFEK